MAIFLAKLALNSFIETTLHGNVLRIASFNFVLYKKSSNGLNEKEKTQIFERDSILILKMSNN